MGAPFFVVEHERLVGAETVRLDGPEGRHAATVRRLRPGEGVVLTDGHGLRVECRVATAARDHLDLVVEETAHVAPPQPRVVVVQALPKGDRGELAVELLTEVGVDVIVPWTAARCVARWRDDRGEKALERWRSTGREAAKQSRRAWIPEVTAPEGTEGVAARLRSAALAVVLHEEAVAPLAGVAVPASGEIVVVVGPEGGITPTEVSAFEAAGAVAMRLGDTVLRTSTAGTAAVAGLLSRTARWL